MKYSINNYFFFIFIVISTACSSHSLEDFREEGEGISRSILSELKTVHSRKDLLEARPRLTKLFNDLVDIMIAAQEFRQNHAQAEILPISKEGQILNDQLQTEFVRIYSNIEGGRELIEKCQEDALNSLDAHNKRAANKAHQLTR